ncbi:hypothetical protein [Fodinicurvata sp. EGI_FJ10296]|uniref:hypothetical protein n=1 Tax=Fodinicurvata sp. EGI_FJ10296 TaxID=3231908 RepID=UPI003454F029
MTKQQSVVSRLGGLLAILAIASAIFYVFYVIYWSGETVTQIELASQGRSEELPVALDPTMNPVRAVLGLEYSGRIGRRIARYDVAIGGDEEAEIKDIFTHSGIANDSSDESGRSIRVRGHNINLGTFEVPLDAGYLVRANIAASNGIDIESATVTLTANSAVWNFRIVGGLAVTFIFGFVMVVAGRSRKTG